jgi:hypothetical protein
MPNVCEKALLVIAYLCRYSDENKSSVCLENAKVFGLSNTHELVINSIKRHKDDKRVVAAACDAIRSMCQLESNRHRFGAVGGCEVLARALVKFIADVDLLCWLCRAVGHIANNFDQNRELLGAAGACQSVIAAIQKHSKHVQLCGEACYAIRQIAPTEENRTRFSNEYAPECILAVFQNKTHWSTEAFAVEACHALANLIGSEDDDIIPRIAGAQFITYALRSLKVYMQILILFVFDSIFNNHEIYYLSTNTRNFQIPNN